MVQDRSYENLWLCSKCHTIILLLLFLQHAVCMLCIVCKFSVCMEYPDDLLYLPESAKYNSSTLKAGGDDQLHTEGWRR